MNDQVKEELRGHPAWEAKVVESSKQSASVS
jgi:hypothetical protein